MRKHIKYPVFVSHIQVVKEIATASRDVSAEDSLYETVKELKDPPTQLGLPNGTIQLSPDEPPHHPPVLLNGHLSPSTPERGPLCTGVEYASVDLNKKSRHSADMEAKRRSENIPSHRPLEEPEDLPPPVPEKVLDENDNQPVVMNGLAGAGLHNGEVRMVCECVCMWTPVDFSQPTFTQCSFSPNLMEQSKPPMKK